MACPNEILTFFYAQMCCVNDTILTLSFVLLTKTDKVEEDNGNWPHLEKQPQKASRGMTEDMIYCLGNDNQHYNEPLKRTQPAKKKVRFAKTPTLEPTKTETSRHRKQTLGQVMSTCYERVSRKGIKGLYMEQTIPCTPVYPKKKMGHLLIQNSQDELDPGHPMVQTIWEGMMTNLKHSSFQEEAHTDAMEHTIWEAQMPPTAQNQKVDIAKI